MSKVEYGLQMYSVRDIASTSLKTALEEVAKLGYKYIEFAGFFDNDASDVKKWLDDNNLICSGTHTLVRDIKPETIDKTIEYHKTIGCDTLIVPSCDWRTNEILEETLNTFKFAKEKLAEHGIKFAYHNHSSEFFANANGIKFMNELLSKTDINMEIDTFWVYNAGIDVIEFLNEHKDRIHVIHLKDGLTVSPEKRVFDEVQVNVKGKSLGDGDAPIAKIRAWAIENNVRMVVESENLDPSGPEEVARCIKYLRTLD